MTTPPDGIHYFDDFYVIILDGMKFRSRLRAQFYLRTQGFTHLEAHEYLASLDE
jgi:hypothetical protein